MEYLPTFNIDLIKPNVGRYTIDGAYRIGSHGDWLGVGCLNKKPGAGGVGQWPCSARCSFGPVGVGR